MSYLFLHSPFVVAPLSTPALPRNAQQLLSAAALRRDGCWNGCWSG